MDGLPMTTRDAGSTAQTEPKRLRFDRYVLDLGRGCLLLDGSEIDLRPKTFAVLQYLIENSGRLVSKDELFAAVWPNLAVTDDALVQSIGELRRALGDDGPRLIRTIPRRGYRFESAVSVIAPAGPPATDGTPESPASHDGAQSLEPATVSVAALPDPPATDVTPDSPASTPSPGRLVQHLGSGIDVAHDDAHRLAREGSRRSGARSSAGCGGAVDQSRLRARHCRAPKGPRSAPRRRSPFSPS